MQHGLQEYQQRAVLFVGGEMCHIDLGAGVLARFGGVGDLLGILDQRIGVLGERERQHRQHADQERQYRVAGVFHRLGNDLSYEDIIHLLKCILCRQIILLVRSVALHVVGDGTRL